MRRTTASGDDVFKAFDDAIETYLTKNRKAIEQEYRKVAGKPVSDADVDSLVQGLGDSIYQSVALDPSHVKRFVDFYVSDDKLQKAVSSAIERATSTAYSPDRAASDISAVADALDRASRPSASKLAAAISRILSRV